MYYEIYKVLKDEISDYAKILNDGIKFFREKLYNSDFLQGMQTILAAIQEELRKYRLENTEVFKLLENDYEYLFRLFNGEELEEKIAEDFERFNEVIKESCNLNDNKLSIVCIIRNEGRYIREWINFHRVVGVSHFYIYDNESTDDIQEVLKPFIKKNLVTLISYPGDCVQLKAYNDAIENFKYETKYMAFIDADEFITPIDPKKKIYEIIEEVNELSKGKFYLPSMKFAGVAVNWMTYGSSHYKESPKGYVIENYLWRAEDDNEINSHVKSICNPRDIEKFRKTPHIPACKQGNAMRSENGTIIVGPWMHDMKYKKIKICHYTTKSEEDYIRKRKRGWPDQEHRLVMEEKIQQEIANREYLNAVYDDSMKIYLEKIEELDKELSLDEV